MEAAGAPRVFLSIVFDPGLHEPLRQACPGLIWDPREIVAREPGRTIEDVCRELIRKSRLFVGVFDERGGRAPFEEGIEPVTVLEIELLQALFEPLPVHLFLLPGFEHNRRLCGLVDLARRQGRARVHPFPEGGVQVADGGRRVITPSGLAAIRGVLRDPPAQRLARGLSGLARRFRAFNKLDVCLLDIPAVAVADPFDARQVERQLGKTAMQTDHAAQLSYLWPALRQLSSVPYDKPTNAWHAALWERLASAWDRSAAWYGLHDDSPIGKLAAVNTLIALYERGPLARTRPDLARGARASGFYSMAKRLWNPFARRKLFHRAREEAEAAIAAAEGDTSGYIAIRASVNLKLWHTRQAVTDYETVVAARQALNHSQSSQGEAWVELGWGYFCALRLSKARTALRRGIALMRKDYRRDPSLRADFLIRALLKHALAFVLMLRFREARDTAREGCRLAHERLASDQLGGVRGKLCRWWIRAA